MIIRAVTEADLPSLAAWFSARKWPMPPQPGVFPKVGFVAESNDELLACAFLYTTGSAVSFIDWTAHSPDISEQAGQLALTRVIEHMKAEVCMQAEPAITVLCAYAGNDRYTAKLKKLGFKSRGQVEQLTWVQRA